MPALSLLLIVPAVDPEIVVARYELANELAKQLIALSTGVIAVTITFLEPRRRGRGAREWALKLTWILHLISTLAGILAMSSLTGELAPATSATIPDTIGDLARGLATLQLLTFLLGAITMVVFGFGLLRGARHPREPHLIPQDAGTASTNEWRVWRRWVARR